MVFAHLDSDLPLLLWWQDDFPEPMDPQLWEWVDRLIFDSQTWRDFGAQMRLVETAQQEAKQRIVLCDLNWTRLDKVRYAIAQFFDHPASHHHFGKIENLNIDYAPGFKSTALFLIGWLRSEEHTSELQSLRHLVCRLLLEKKNNTYLLERGDSHHGTDNRHAPPRPHVLTRVAAVLPPAGCPTAALPLVSFQPAGRQLLRPP